MKLIHLPIVLVLLFCSTACAAIDLPKDGFSPGWTRSGESLLFPASELYGRIDGGAELFLEFGFKLLTVQDYTNAGQKLELEIYEMDSPASALGIYLTRSYNETPWKEVAARNSADISQLMALKGRYLVQVNNFDFSDALKPVMTALANAVLVKIDETEPVRLLDRLPTKGLVPGSELLVRGPFALQPVYTFGPDDILSLRGEVFGVAGDFVAGGDTSTLILVTYPDDKQARSAFRHLRDNLDPYLEILKQSDSDLVFRDYRKQYGLALLRGPEFELRVNLDQQPTAPYEMKSR